MSEPMSRDVLCQREQYLSSLQWQMCRRVCEVKKQYLDLYAIFWISILYNSYVNVILLSCTWTSTLKIIQYMYLRCFTKCKTDIVLFLHLAALGP